MKRNLAKSKGKISAIVEYGQQNAGPQQRPKSKFDKQRTSFNNFLKSISIFEKKENRKIKFA